MNGIRDLFQPSGLLKQQLFTSYALIALPGIGLDSNERLIKLSRFSMLQQTLV